MSRYYCEATFPSRHHDLRHSAKSYHYDHVHSSSNSRLRQYLPICLLELHQSLSQFRPGPAISSFKFGTSLPDDQDVGMLLLGIYVQVCRDHPSEGATLAELLQLRRTLLEEIMAHDGLGPLTHSANRSSETGWGIGCARWLGLTVARRLNSG
ncbi:hypothetical protein NEOLEDRAFT_978575 [Neolentinus lepideus HHB14362 ss-1]|uniref:Uncharacterized protein n=1 Tax=Neolentinus lepideus HHB14362 ss-1 TaxID=1314782 RepID=A0A165N8S8_9AGAM|nr:hypothetical protein NEOLEDRAFT_978575 [Neolentinus lepideus HHB14362 ss-1]